MATRSWTQCWFEENGQPVERSDEAPWHRDLPQGKPLTERHLARFFDGLVGCDAGANTRILALLVERVLFSTITHPTRLVGGWEDLFQEGMATALQEVRKLRSSATEKPNRYAACFERRVTLAVRHRVIDVVRRQDAATRTVPCTSLEAGQEAGMDVPAWGSKPRKNRKKRGSRSSMMTTQTADTGQRTGECAEVGARPSATAESESPVGRWDRTARRANA